MNQDQYLEALLALPRIYSPIVSFDRKWVAWTAFGVGDAAEVYVAPTGGSAPPVRMTDTPEKTIAVSWTPDSRAVLVRQDHQGDERYQLFRVDIDRLGAMAPLTEPSPAYFLRGGQLHPDGRRLVYGANIDAATGREIEPTWVYVHDLETGERKPLARPEKPAFYEPQMNEQGTHVLYTRKDLHPSGEQVWLVDIEGREDREILNFGPEVKVFASWFPDGRRVLFRAEAGTYTRLGVWHMDAGDLTWLLDDPNRNLEDAYVPPGSDQAVVVEVKEAGLAPSLLDLATGQETRLPRISGNLLPLAPIESGEWIGQYWSSTQPADLVRFPLNDIRPEKFASVSRIWENTPLTPADLAPAQDFRWRSVDGLEVQGWLYRPKDEARGTIVYVHGGPTGHSEDRVNAEIQYYVSRGFNVLDPNYRGSTGFSLGFREAIKEDGWGGREQDDIRAGIEALIEAGIAERGKVGMTGTSYGGYSSWCGITRWPPAVLAASAPVCGMTDLVVDYESTRPDLRPYSEEMIGGRPDQVPERYYKRSPANFVDNIKGRLLIVQGLQDPNVTPRNVSAVEEALRRAGVPYELLAFEDEGHGIYRSKNRRVLYPRLAEFFEEAFEGSTQQN
jgi:dipeptidyl aminopeptidase/acylaminoacyl peptidase